MTPDELRNLPSADDLTPLLGALWHASHGNWERAHELAQGEDTPQGAHVHAYLHRKEGDESNARYWYARANASVSNQTLAEEWAALVGTVN